MADLGPDVALATDLNGDAETVPKAPKRRFIGRKAADAKAAARAEAGDSNSIESGAVQGWLRKTSAFVSLAKLTANSCTSSEAIASTEQCA